MAKRGYAFLFFALVVCGVRPAVAQQQPETPATKLSGNAASARSALPPEKAQPVRVPRFETPPVIDGELDDGVWKQAARLKDFYQTWPGDNTPPTYPTEVLLGYDAKTLYVAFHAYDDPNGVRATVAKRDHVTDADDSVRILLDTFNDRRRAYVLIFNPLGIQQDGVRTEGVGVDFSVDVVVTSKGVITKDGYTVEVAVPFKSLRYEAGRGVLWGVQTLRITQRLDGEVDSWMPNSRDNASFLDQEGHITGLEGVAAGRTLELIPSLTVSETGRRVRAVPRDDLLADPALLDPGRFVNESVKPDPGLTVKLGITPNVTLDFALNPDFAQVEADQTVVTANQRFPVFFEEKRPFFLEGIDIFKTPIQAVHTRAVVDPDVALKLTGKRGRNSFGLLAASDNAPGNFNAEERADLTFDYDQCLGGNPTNPGMCADPRRLFDKNATVGVLRLKHDVGEGSSVGLLATSYDFVERHNHLGGFDGRFQISPQTVFTFQALGTTSRRFFYDPVLDRNVYRIGNGFAYFAKYSRTSRHLNLALEGLGFTRDYRADVGFTNRTDTNSVSPAVQYNSEPRPKAALISWSLVGRSYVQFDWRGRTQAAYHYPKLVLNFKRQTYLNVWPLVGYERLFEEEFGAARTVTRAGAFAGPRPERSTRWSSFEVDAGTTPSKRYSAGVSVDYTWDFFDYDFGAGPKFPRVSPAALKFGQGAPLDPGPGGWLYAAASAVYQPTGALRLSLDYTKSRVVRNDTRLTAFDENIYSLRAAYQFTRFAFARARADYDSIASNFRGQFLLGWTPNPGTSFYVGYNDDMNRNGFSPFTGQPEPGLRRNGQTFFIKMSYLFRRNIGG